MDDHTLGDSLYARDTDDAPGAQSSTSLSQPK
jgi:hypothetical protein